MTVTVRFSDSQSPVNLGTDDTLALTPNDEWAGCNFNGPVVLMPKAGFEAQARDARFGQAVRESRAAMPNWKRKVARVLDLH